MLNGESQLTWSVKLLPPFALLVFERSPPVTASFQMELWSELRTTLIKYFKRPVNKTKTQATMAITSTKYHSVIVALDLQIRTSNLTVKYNLMT